MGLSRLDNFLKNARGDILYVNPNDLDATDSIENQGNSLTRPFKTIQRALIEASRFSYQKGLDNDRFGKTTILLYPGEHIVDNRPGWIPDGSNNFKLRNGTTSSDFPAWSLTTNFNLDTPDNALYKMNSIYGGVILPRGTSIVGLDLRKTKIRPKYVPNPANTAIEHSALFRVTGSCYLWQFTMFDGDPNGVVYKDYTENTFVPNFSHHKLTCFEYADGVNDVEINDSFITDYTTNRTDLDMYYEKVGLVYGPGSGREIEPDYPSSGVDIQPKIDEYRIVGPTGGEVGITSIKAGDGSVSSSEITVTLEDTLTGLDVDTAFEVSGITASGYDGQFVVSDVVSSTVFKYQVSNPPLNALPTTTGATVNLQVDTVTSASPYIFNCSLRSVYGMCGMFADGNKATGFKSMVVAQFTGIGLQKDNNAFVKYDTSSGEYKDTTFAGNENIANDSEAVYKPLYQNYHVKATNDAVIQIVSTFAIGYAQHFLTESGGDLSVTNSNSNFGAKSLVSKGYKVDAFPRDDVGYITHIIPPKQIETSTVGIEYDAIDVSATVGIASTSRLYLYNQTNEDVLPDSVIEGYRIGAKSDDQLNVLIPDATSGVTNQYSARIVMPDTELTTTQVTSKKVFDVGRASGINSISGNTVTLSEVHSFLPGESVRVISENGHLPDGLDSNTVYYAITAGVSSDQVKIAKTLNDATALNALTINEKGGVLKVVSRVSDKISGDIGHPIQWDSSQGNWYVTVGTATTDNDVYSTLISLGTTSLGAATPRTFIQRTPDTRNTLDTIYTMRYVIPSGSGITSARPPVDGYIYQESSEVIGSTNAEVDKFFSPTEVTLSNLNELRNPSYLSNASWDSNKGYYTSELPHGLKEGSKVLINNVTSANNPLGAGNSGYNGTFEVAGISSAKEFVVNLASTTGPGTFTNDINSRTTSLPTFTQKDYVDTFSVYRSKEVQKYISGEQDGVYHLIVTDSSTKPTVTPFSTERYSQSIQNLYPQTNRDNPHSNAPSASSFALSSPIGEVVTNELQNSITRETLETTLLAANIGIALTDIASSSSAGTAHTFTSIIDHGLNPVTNVSIANSGEGYGTGSETYLYDATLVAAGAATTVGQYATARIGVNASGNITSVKIMDGGSAYSVDDTLNVAGVGTFGTWSVGVVTVTSIYDNVGDTLSVAGVIPDSNDEYNQLYRITAVPSPTKITVASASTVSVATTTGIGVTNTANATATLTGQSLNVSAFNYNFSTSVGIVTTVQSHGLRVDNKIFLGGADNPLYRGDFIVKKIDSSTSFQISIASTIAPTVAGTMYAYPYGYSSAGGNVSNVNENLGGRQGVQYAGITTTLSAAILTESTTSVEITNIGNLGINIGDFLVIGQEIVRVKTTVSSNPITVFRGVLGTKASTHSLGSVVKKILCRPIEFHRNSIIRASGHTFEYVGFGPGNYSTALPERQNRTLTAQEELLAQSTKQDGGVNVYTGMNDAGDFYIGNKKVSSATGQEEVFDAPIPSVTGEDVQTGGINIGFDVLTPLEASISRSIRVEGGPNASIISEFDGPVIFNNKLTSTSTKGIEAASIFLQGDATISRKQTVGISTPVLAGNPGDLTYNANPAKGGYVGWMYSTENDWYRFGNVSIAKNSNINIFDQVGIGTTTPGANNLQVNNGGSIFSVDALGATGIGTTAGTYKFQVIGNSNFIGIVTATSFQGDGAGLTNLSNDSLWAPVSSGLGTGIYPIDSNRVGVGTTVPHYPLHVGQVGSGVTDLYVTNSSEFAGRIITQDVSVGGALTATTYRLDSSSGHVSAGIVTTTSLDVGVGGTVITAEATGSVGLGTASPRAVLDVDGASKFKTYSENVEVLDISSGAVEIDLSKGQSFTLTVDESVTQFNLVNPPSGSTAFTVKILQDSTGYSVGIDTFKDNGGSTIPVYWPGGGVVPIVTQTASKTDVYSFMTFDGGSSLFGVVGGQNFA
tara:strand:+ start:1142 stop:7000 length:5859 start_codon:yes stop_codon:yes gene_type:complete